MYAIITGQIWIKLKIILFNILNKMSTEIIGQLPNGTKYHSVK